MLIAAETRKTYNKLKARKMHVDRYLNFTMFP